MSPYDGLYLYKKEERGKRKKERKEGEEEEEEEEEEKKTVCLDRPTVGRSEEVTYPRPPCQESR